MNAVILVDIQNDFCPGGALAVSRGDEVVPVANALTARAKEKGWPVLATQDWHPPTHGSFASQYPGRKPYEMGELGGLPQVLWPDHCVQGTVGAALHPALEASRIEKVVPKGTDAAIDSYSGFFDNGHRKKTGLDDELRSRAVKHVYVMGLATDYCVRATCLDARQLGYEVTLVADGCRAVELTPGDGTRALDEMRAAGIRICQLSEVV